MAYKADVSVIGSMILKGGVHQGEFFYLCGRRREALGKLGAPSRERVFGYVNRAYRERPPSVQMRWLVSNERYKGL